MSDDGIGLLVVAEAEKRLGAIDGVEFFDLGTGGLSVLHEIAGRPKVVFIDCTLMDKEPGTLQRFTPDEVRSKARIRFSAHEGDLLNIIQLSRDMGECPEEIVILGIQPKKTDDGMAVSEELLTRMDEYVDAVKEELRPSPTD